MNWDAPKGLYNAILYIRSGKSAIGRYEPPNIITALSTIQYIGFIASIQNDKKNLYKDVR